MSNFEQLLATLHVGSSRDELREVGLFLGRCVNARDSETLEHFYDRLRSVLRAAEPGTFVANIAETMVAFLDGYFASIEETVRQERLVREIAAIPLWHHIVHALSAHGELNQSALREEIARHDSTVASSKSAISVALDELRVREVVETIPGEDRRERLHSLSFDGQAVATRLPPPPEERVVPTPPPPPIHAELAARPKRASNPPPASTRKPRTVVES